MGQKSKKPDAELVSDFRRYELGSERFPVQLIKTNPDVSLKGKFNWLKDPLSDFRRSCSKDKNSNSTSGSVSTITVFRDFDAYITDDGQVGAFLRTLVALELLANRQFKKPDWVTQPGTTLTSLFKEFLFPLGTDEPTEQLRDEFSRSYTERSRPRQPVEMYKSGPVLERIIEKLNEAVLPNRYKPIDLTAFLNTPTRRPGQPFSSICIDHFADFLRYGCMPPLDDLESLEAEPFLTTRDDEDERERLLKGAIDAIRSQGPAHHAPIIQVWSSDTWCGLRAFATTLIYRLIELPTTWNSESRPTIVYLNLASIGTGRESATLQRVTHALNNVFGIVPSHDINRTSDQTFNLERDTLPLSIALAQYPTVIIFGAHAGPPNGPFRSVQELIVHKQFAEFIRVLAQPRMRHMHLTDAKFRTKFVMLSGAADHELAPWMSFGPIELPPPDKSTPLRNLICIRSSDDETTVAERDMQKILGCIGKAGPLGRFGASSSKISLRQLYGDVAHRLDSLELESEEKGPSEFELAVISLANNIEYAGAPKWQAHGENKRTAASYFSSWLKTLKRDRYWDWLSLCLIATACNGLRISTAMRCLSRWKMLAEHANRKIEMSGKMTLDEYFKSSTCEIGMPNIGSIATRYPQLIISRNDEQVESFHERIRIFEIADLPNSDDAENEPDQRSYDVATETIRSRIIGSLYCHDEIGFEPSEGNPSVDFWGDIHYILAEEALRQATSHMRNLNRREFENLYAHRRIVQAIYHGLLSLGAGKPAAQLEGEALNDIPYFILPIDKQRRFKYIYSFLYKRCLETPEWNLTRDYARPGLKMQLLKMFIDPNGAASCLLSACSNEFWRPNLSGWNWTFDRDLKIEILHSLGHACLECSDAAMVDLVIEAAAALMLEKIPSEVVVQENAIELISIALKILQRGEDRKLTATVENRLAFNKLVIDALLEKNLPDAALKKCGDFLDAELLHSPVEERKIFSATGELTLLFDIDSWDSSCKRRIDAQLSDLANRCANQCPTSSHKSAYSDILFRMAEAVALRAETIAAPNESYKVFLHSYALYWIADRLRISGSIMGNDDEWPRASSRSLRYFARVCLKLAKLLGKSRSRKIQNTGTHAENKRWTGFYLHAKFIAGIHIRHHFTLRREKVATLLLQATICRVWAELAIFENDTPSEINRALVTSVRYLERAEAAAMEMGYPNIVARRLLLEHSVTTKRLFDANLSENRWTVMSKRSILSLGRIVQGSPYWLALVARNSQ